MAKKEDEFRWNSMSKAELIKTVKTLHRRQTKLLNEIATLKDQLVSAAVVTQHVLDSRLPEVTYPEGDGIALTSIEHPPGLIEKITDAIKSGKLSLAQKQNEAAGFGPAIPEVEYARPASEFHIGTVKKLPWETNELPNPFDEVKP